MKRLTVRSCAIPVTSALCLVAALRLSAQTAAPDQGQKKEEDADKTLVLSPFVVEATEDTGYAAKDTLAGTRVRTDLKDVGSAISVVTQKFLQDTNSKSSADLLVYTTSTEVAGQSGNFTGGGDGAIIDTTAYTKPVANTRVRGLAEADNLRDFFLTDIPWDSYNVGRVDMQRGANSVLFGIGSPAGIINSSVNSASFKDYNKVEVQADNYGTYRGTFDFNKVLLKNELSIRVAGVDDKTKYKQKPAHRDDKRLFAAIKWEPQFFKMEGAHTSIRANFEKGTVDANYPRLTPPIDAITPFFGSYFNKNGLNWLNSNNVTSLGNPAYNPYVGAAGSRIWDGVAGAFNSPNDSTPAFLFSADAKNVGTPVNFNNPSNGSYKGIVTFDNFASNARYPGWQIHAQKATTLTDASIFDFYNNLMEGPNKKNWTKFKAANFNIGQTFFNNKLGFELAYDNQDTTWGWRNAVSGDAAAITIDIMKTFVDGSPNPNYGRAMTILGGGSAGSGDVNRTRKTVRGTAFGELDFKDFMDPKALITEILGHQNFTVNYTDYTEQTIQRGWVNWYTGTGYTPVAGASVGQATRDVTPLTYLSGSLLGASSAANLHVQRITAFQLPQNGSVVQWNAVTGAFQSYAVPIVVPDQQPSSTRDLTGASKQKQTIKSEVGVWQGYFWNDNIIPMIGWRKDISETFDAGSPNKPGGIVSGFYGPDFHIPTGSMDVGGPTNRSYARVEGQTHTFSIVAHMPKEIMKNLPGGLGFSVFYNRSENFQPDSSRKDILGAAIAAPTGHTKDYGIAITAFDEKLALKVNKYETQVTNATLSGAIGGAYLIGAGEAWGNAAAYHLKVDDGIWPGDGNYGTTSAASKYGAGHTLRWQPAGNGIGPGNGTVYSQADVDAQYDIQRASTDDWFAHLVPAAFQAAWGMTGYATGSGNWSMNSVVVTGDTLSKGTEFEIVAQPIKGLDISLNAAKTDARRLNIAKAYSDWIDKRWKDYQGPMGDMRMWGNGNWALTVGSGGTVRDKFNNEVIPSYKLALALNGSNVPELRPWRYNLVTNYSFQSEQLRGVNVGGSYRWEDKQVTGFRLNATQDGYNVNDPYYGPSLSHLDLWVGYERKLNKQVKWRVQLNVRDVFATKKLIPVTVQPDGAPGAYRIPDPRVVNLTTSFEF